MLCFKYERVVRADNTVQLGEHRLQLLADDCRLSWARVHVEVHERLDGSLAVYQPGPVPHDAAGTCGGTDAASAGVPTPGQPSHASGIPPHGANHPNPVNGSSVGETTRKTCPEAWTNP